MKDWRFCWKLAVVIPSAIGLLLAGADLLTTAPTFEEDSFWTNLWFLLGSFGSLLVLFLPGAIASSWARGFKLEDRFADYFAVLVGGSAFVFLILNFWPGEIVPISIFVTSLILGVLMFWDGVEGGGKKLNGSPFVPEGESG